MTETRVERLDEQLGGAEHVLLLTMHHAVADEWSMRVLLRELRELYEAREKGREPRLPPLAVQYGDYALWQRDWLAGPAPRRQLAYWRERLEGLEPLALPTDRPRPPQQRFRGGVERLLLPPTLVERLEQVGGGQGATTFMTLVAAFQVLLRRLSGQTDVAVGTPVAERSRPELEPLIGFFLNTVVLRVSEPGDPGFRSFLERVREVCLGAYAHADLPFAKLVEELQPERDPSRSPLFQVLFTFQDEPLDALRVGPLRLRPLELDAGTAKFDLSLACRTRSDGGLRLVLTYDRDLFGTESARRLLRLFVRVLEAVASEPDTRLSELQLLDDAERAQLAAWSRGPDVERTSATVHELVERQAERTPDAPALVHEGRELTYAELERRARQLAQELRSRGVRAEVVVGVHLRRSLELVVCLLAVLKAGGAYLPLDPESPAERLASMLDQSACTLVLTERTLCERLPPGERDVLRVDELELQGERDDAAAAVHPESLAYVVYTSGSTGQPKGVGVPHRALVNYLRAAGDRLGLRPGWRHALLQSVAFDLPLTVLWGSLTSGGTLHVVPAETAFDPNELRRYLVEERIDCVKITPSHLATLAPDGEAALPADLRCLVVGGEASSAEWLDALRRSGHGCRVFNHYGPTEATVGATTYELGARRAPAQTTPIGRPLAGCAAHVLDGRLERVPVGVSGDLYLGGAGVARGYLGRPELTAERFVPDPFEPGARLYRTGDRVRYLPDGNLEFLGRDDAQVKVRGFRVELEEVEAALTGDSAVARAAVAAVNGPAGGRLAAYVVPEAGCQVDSAALRERLRRSLPEYMVPSRFVELDALPLTANGKLDRARLPDPSLRRPALDERYVAPRDDIEAAIAAVWSELLGLEQIGVYDRFFEIGGHSLVAARVVSALREALGVELPLRDVFEHPTIAELAVAARLAPKTRLPTIEPQPRVPFASVGARGTDGGR